MITVELNKAKTVEINCARSAAMEVSLGDTKTIHTTATWSEISGKPFSTIDTATLAVESSILSVRNGLPSEGTQYQVLMKESDTDFNATWTTLAAVAYNNYINSLSQNGTFIINCGTASTVL